MRSRPRSLPPTATVAFLLSAVLCTVPAPVRSQAPDTVVAVAGTQYRAGLLHRWILGRHYRDVWTTPVRVEVLDLEGFAGGLTPLRTGGGQQTRSLRFLGADGREYSFRSVDKDPSAVLDTIFVGTVVDELVQDGISAAHPYGALVAEPLLEAAGVLHVEPRLRVMPDSPELGAFRDEFAGMLGLIEERPDENDGGRTAFRDARRVISSETLTERVGRAPDDRVDPRAFLTARLMDVFLGDWDRHRGQWRWATYDEDDPVRWLPVPRDRDQAFSKFDGFATRIVSLYMPQFVRFEEDYPSIVRLHWNGRALDRWFLSGVERAVWDSIGGSLVERLTDGVIQASVDRLPPEIRAQGGDELARTLIARRDALPRAWDAFYRLLAEDVDVRTTDAEEVVSIDRTERGRVSVRVTAPGFAEPEIFFRTFHEDETDEVRVYLNGGDDRVEVTGAADSRIVVRVIGGEGRDRFEVSGRGDRLAFYDSGSRTEVEGGPASLLRTKEWDEWVWTEEDRDQPRDWGRRTRPVFWSSFASDLGPFVGGGATIDHYGFRKRPYASRVDIRGGWAPAQQTGRLEVEASFRRENSALYGITALRLSGLDVLSYYGLGNDSPAGPSEFHEVGQHSASAAVGVGLSLGSDWTLEGRATISRSGTSLDPATFFGQERDTIYGADDFDELRLGFDVVYDARAGRPEAPNQFRFRAGGGVYPDLLDVQRGFASAHSDVSVLLAPGDSSPVRLALRGAWQQVWGRFPWSAAAFLGGPDDLRGWRVDRFAGDASLYASAELRLRLLSPRVVVPVDSGVFGFADVGRVFLDRASPGGWHDAFGGGIWLEPVGQSFMLRTGFGRSVESTKFFAALGLPY